MSCDEDKSNYKLKDERKYSSKLIRIDNVLSKNEHKIMPVFLWPRN